MKPVKKRTTIALPDRTLEAGQNRADALGYPSLSAYLEHLIADDVDTGGAHVVVRDEGGTYYSKQHKPAPPTESDMDTRTDTDPRSRDADGPGLR